MRKLFLIGGAAALIALPSVALADTSEQVPETDPTAEEGTANLATSALHAEGKGYFHYDGSGGVVITGNGLVQVLDSSRGDLAVVPTGFGVSTTTKNGRWTRYAGGGTISLDGSDFTVKISGKFTVDANATATHAAAGRAKVAGKGTTALKGGIAIPFWASRNLLLTTGPMSVDLSGRGHRGWEHKGRHHRGKHGGKHVTVRRVVTTRRVENGRVVSRHRVETTRRWWTWDKRAPGATWRLNGPAAGTAALTTVTGRVRVWDKSAGKDLAVTGIPAGTRTTTLGDGSVVYSGLKGATVTITGTAFRMKVRAWDVEGTFTPAPGSLARSFVKGKGEFDAGAVQDEEPGRSDGIRVLLQPAGAPA